MLARVGAMRERVDVYSQAQTVNSAGEITTTWTNVATIWARMEPVGAAAVALANRDDAQRSYNMTIRYTADVTTNSRVIWRGRKFDVEGIMDPTEQRQFLSVRLREINA